MTFLEVAADLPDRHAAGVHRDDLLVKVRKPALVFGNQFRIEGPSPIARHRQCHLRSGDNPKSRVDGVGRGMGAWKRTLAVSCNRCHFARGRFERFFAACSGVEKGQFLSLARKFYWWGRALAGRASGQ